MEQLKSVESPRHFRDVELMSDEAFSSAYLGDHADFEERKAAEAKEAERKAEEAKRKAEEAERPPSIFKSSALSTAPPAAPRTVLCPIATNL